MYPCVSGMLAVWNVTYCSAFSSGCSLCSAAACVICAKLWWPWRARIAASFSKCATFALHIVLMSTAHRPPRPFHMCCVVVSMFCFRRVSANTAMSSGVFQRD